MAWAVPYICSANYQSSGTFLLYLYISFNSSFPIVNYDSPLSYPPKISSHTAITKMAAIENRYSPLQGQFTDEEEDEGVGIDHQPQEGWGDDNLLDDSSSEDSVLQPPFSKLAKGASKSKRLQKVKKKQQPQKVKSPTKGRMYASLVLSDQEVAFLSRSSAPTSLQHEAIKPGFPMKTSSFGCGGGMSESSTEHESGGRISNNPQPNAPTEASSPFNKSCQAKDGSQPASQHLAQSHVDPVSYKAVHPRRPEILPPP
jgi:hypothetical protein